MIRFVEYIPWQTVHLEDIVIHLSSPTSRVNGLGLNGRGNFLAFLCCCFLEQAKVNPQLFSNSRISGGVNYAILTYLKSVDSSTLQLVIDDDSWKKDTSTSTVIESPAVGTHYLQLIVQLYYELFHPTCPNPTEAGCLSACPFKPTLLYIMDKLKGEDATPFGSLLHYVYYMIPQTDYLQYLTCIQEYCNPLAMIGRFGSRSVVNKQKRIIQYCNYANLMTPDLPSG